MNLLPPTPKLEFTDGAKLRAKLADLLADPCQAHAGQEANFIQKRLERIAAEANALAAIAFSLQSGLARVGFANKPRGLPESTWAKLEAATSGGA